MTTTHIGYGRFHLGLFRPGEEFARFDGTLCKVCNSQPLRNANRVQVWTDFGTINATKVFLHCRAIVHAVTAEQARLIETRQQERTPSMDPHAAWQELLAAYAANDLESFRDLAEGLRHWLARGGFPPRITNHPAIDRCLAEHLVSLPTINTLFPKGESLES